MQNPEFRRQNTVTLKGWHLAQRGALVVLALLLVVPRESIDAQVRPIYDSGAAGLVHLLGRLQTTASVLHTGAHPDDEDSAFIARTARGDHARVAYLSLTRGEGGQNIIGPELFDALGVIRTEELLQARRLDGGEQFFTRAFDYGFSKTLAEAKSKWNERDVLGDVVRVIRTFRPLVIHSRFAGNDGDGHGQHQFAGYVTPLAFKAAADPQQYPEQIAQGLRPWQARKLYRGAGRGGGDNAATMQVQTGVFDPVIGRSYAAIAAEGRSQHKSQEMGGIEPLGPSASGLRLIESRTTAVANETSIFDGLDTSITGLPALMGLPQPTLSEELKAVDTAARTALRQFNALEPERIVPVLADGVRATRAARQALRSATVENDARADVEFILARKEADFTEALAQAAGIVVDPLAEDETVVPGGSVDVTVRTFLERGALAKVTDVALKAPNGWRVEPARPVEPPSGGGFRFRESPADATRYRVTAPADAAFTQPYFLVKPRRGSLYDWPADAAQGQPFDPPLISSSVTFSISGTEITLTRPVRYRFADRVRGELRRDLNVVPELAVSFDSSLLVVPAAGPAQPQRLVVTTTSFVDRSVNGTVRLLLPSGWTSTPSSAPFSEASAGDSATATFVVTPPARRTPEAVVIGAEATMGGLAFSSRVEVVAYPHIQNHRLYTRAAAQVEVIDLAVAPVHVGYIMGSGDEVPDALRRMGVNVTMVDREMLATGDLSRFDTIVVGVRASEARPDFVANQARLRAYMERGGTLIVQYQQIDYVERNLPPYPVKSPGNSRVTDETADVRMLVPMHPAFTFPNRITPADFSGWVQERNLYSFGTFDERYTPLLESADPGEPAQRGGEVIAQVGKGRYVYTSYSWFRQLRAGIPGAYRQFANLISLPKARAR
jgi:LmbE family N-acetylglucosaminyl deacetylase